MNLQSLYQYRYSISMGIIEIFKTSMYICTLDVINFFLLLPHKRCLIISHLQKSFQFCSKPINESVSSLHILVQVVLKWAVGRTRSGLTDSLKNLEKN